MRDVLITGGAGYIGSRLASLLRREGVDVTCLVRDPARTAILRQVGAGVVVGDVRDREGLRAAVSGKDTVFHLAAVWSGTPRTVSVVNTVGTENMVEACTSQGVEKFIFASSLAVHGNVRGAQVDEAYPLRPNTVFGRSKAEAEDFLLRSHAGAGFPAVILRLGVVYGPDARILREEALLRGALWLAGAGNYYASFIHVDDVVRAMAAAARRGLPGEVYVVCDDEPATVRAFYETVAERLGVPSPRPLPVPLALALAGCSELVARLSGGSSWLNVDLVRMFTSSVKASNAKMKERLEVALTYPHFRAGIPGAARRQRREGDRRRRERG